MAFDFKNASKEARNAEYKRIAKEMGDDGFFTKKELNHLPEVLHDGEDLLGFASGMMDNKTWLIALTDQRILLLDKGMLYGLRQTEFRLGNVSAISYETGMLMGKLVIQVGSVEHTISHVPKKAVATFAERAREAVAGPQSVPPEPAGQTQGDDVVSQLERLASLKERGILDDEEFAAQKAKLLS